jgi:hypothetical protein
MAPIAWLAAAVALASASASAVVLDDTKRIDVVLSDGMNLVLYGEAGASKDYYYLPSDRMLRLSQRPDGTPEFLFLKFTTEERADQGGVSGAILHLLMEWSLLPEQEKELRQILKTQHKVDLGGAAEMLPGEEGGQFRLISATLSDKGMAPAVVTSGKAPLVPGGKVAIAARLDKNGAQLMAATLEKNRSIADLSIAMDFQYARQVPAAKGRITMDWSRFEREHEKIKVDYEKKYGKHSCGLFGWSSCTHTASVNHKQLQEEYQTLIDTKIIEIKFEENVADERIAKIREAFFQYFMNNLTEPAQDEQGKPPAEASDQQKAQKPPQPYGNNYKYSSEKIKQVVKRGTQIVNLDYKMAINYPHQITGNVASWYDHVRDNPKCVSSVNLNDPFFQHRDIIFVLDLDAADMFDEAVNYVTVNVRKKRSAGHDFEDHATIDKKYLGEKGTQVAMTYSRGEDANPDVYEYQSQWSLKGGNVFPQNPPWTKGSWEGVTLAPPVTPRVIEFEGDLAAMESSDITRVTAQVRYWQFGQEKEANIHLSPAKKEALVSQRIFNDREAKGYAYRLVINHKKEGKLALEWTPVVGDNYIYAQIPDDLLTEPTVLDVAKAAAVDMSKAATTNVLARFKNLLGGK